MDNLSAVSQKSIGLSFAKIFLMEYREEWISMFEDEKKQISDTLSYHKNHIEHIGSTAIPGMIAKPIIDIMVGVEKGTDLVVVVELLGSIGYQNFGECGRPGRIFMVKGEPENCTHHLHLVEKESKYWIENLRFREYIKNNDFLANQYKSIKTELAQQFPNNRTMYRIFKSVFVEEIIDKIVWNSCCTTEKCHTHYSKTTQRNGSRLPNYASRHIRL